MFLKLVFALLLVLLPATLPGFSQVPSTFRGIVPLKTTKIEVEKILGKPNSLGRYELDEGRVYIIYREGKCEAADSCICRASVGTVRSVSIQPHEDRLFESLNLDLREWIRSKVSGHVEGIEVCDHEQLGISIEVEVGDRVIRSFSYWETPKTCELLKRGGSATGPMLHHWDGVKTC